MGRLDETGERDEARSRHLRWCLEVAAELDYGGEAGVSRQAFDRVADGLRSALGWAPGARAPPASRPGRVRRRLRRLRLATRAGHAG